MMRLREIREREGLTQAELGQRLNVGANTICQWETGKRNPRAGMLIDLSKILGCSVDELLKE